MPVFQALEELVEKHPAICFWQSHYRLRRKGHPWNHKKVYRIYSAMGLNIRRRHKKRIAAKVKQALFRPESINQVRSIIALGTVGTFGYSTFWMTIIGKGTTRP